MQIYSIYVGIISALPQEGSMMTWLFYPIAYYGILCTVYFFLSIWKNMRVCIGSFQLCNEHTTMMHRKHIYFTYFFKSKFEFLTNKDGRLYYLFFICYTQNKQMSWVLVNHIIQHSMFWFWYIEHIQYSKDIIRWCCKDCPYLHCL